MAEFQGFDESAYAHTPRVRDMRQREAAAAHTQLVLALAMRGLEGANVKLDKARAALAAAELAVSEAEAQLEQAHREADAAVVALEG